MDFDKTDFTITKKKADAPNENQSSQQKESSPSTPIIPENSRKSIQNAKKIEENFEKRDKLALKEKKPSKNVRETRR